MFRSVSKFLTAAGAIVAGGVALFLSGAPEVRAETSEKVAIHQLQVKGARLPVLIKGTGCSSQGWPHFEQGCQFDVRRPAGEVRNIRIIALR